MQINNSIMAIRHVSQHLLQCFRDQIRFLSQCFIRTLRIELYTYIFGGCAPWSIHKLPYEPISFAKPEKRNAYVKLCNKQFIQLVGMSGFKAGGCAGRSLLAPLLRLLRVLGSICFQGRKNHFS